MNAAQRRDTPAGFLETLKLEERLRQNAEDVAKIQAEQRAKQRADEAQYQRALRECATIRAKLGASRVGNHHTTSEVKRPSATTATRPVVHGPTFSRPVKACNKVIG